MNKLKIVILLSISFFTKNLFCDWSILISNLTQKDISVKSIDDKNTAKEIKIKPNTTFFASIKEGNRILSLGEIKRKFEFKDNSVLLFIVSENGIFDLVLREDFAKNKCQKLRDECLNPISNILKEFVSLKKELGFDNYDINIKALIDYYKKNGIDVLESKSSSISELQKKLFDAARKIMPEIIIDRLSIEMRELLNIIDFGMQMEELGFKRGKQTAPSISTPVVEGEEILPPDLDEFTSKLKQTEERLKKLRDKRIEDLKKAGKSTDLIKNDAETAKRNTEIENIAKRIQAANILRYGKTEIIEKTGAGEEEKE
jgi:hypothetical protein